MWEEKGSIQTYIHTLSTSGCCYLLIKGWDSCLWVDSTSSEAFEESGDASFFNLKLLYAATPAMAE